MIDVKFNEAMKPLVKAMDKAGETSLDFPGGEQFGRAMAAAAVEALGIPAQLVADEDFRAQLDLLVQAHKTLEDQSPPAIASARDALERVWYWLACGDEGPEASLPLPSEVSEDKGVGELVEQVRLAARGLGGLQDEDEADTLPPIRADEPEAITEPGLPSFAQDGDDPMRTSSDGPADPPACGAPTDSAT